jgi:hypothetical protein
VTAACGEPQEPKVQDQTSAVARLERVMRGLVDPETLAHPVASVVGQSLPVAPSSSDPAVLVSPSVQGWHGRVHVGIPLYLGSEVEGQKP